MTEYLVTLELKTSTITKILRFFKLKKKRHEFKISFVNATFKPNDILRANEGLLLVIKCLPHQ